MSSRLFLHPLQKFRGADAVQLLDVVLLDVSSVKQYLALGGIVQTGQELKQRRLSGSRFADNGVQRTFFKIKAHTH